MATSPVNNIKRSVAPKTWFPSAKSLVDSSVSFNQGDLIALVSNKLKAVSSDGETATLLGVAKVTVVSGKLKSPYVTDVDASLGVSDVPGPEFGVVVELVANTGDAFNPGDLVYPIASVDAQTVSSSSNTGARTACGRYQGAVIASATAGQKILVMLSSPLSGGSI